MSHSTLNRVIYGQVPPVDLLLAIATTAGVSGGWLLTGEQSVTAGREARDIVLSEHLIPAVPGRERFSPGVAKVEVPSDLDTTNVYAYRVRPDDPIVHVTEWQVAAGDILFFDNHIFFIGLAGLGWGPKLLVVWAWEESESGAWRTCMGDLRPTDGGCTGRLFGKRTTSLPFDCHVGELGSAGAAPAPPSEGGRLTRSHVAAVCRGLKRIFPGTHEPLPIV